jgi:hypothetical protein
VNRSTEVMIRADDWRDLGWYVTFKRTPEGIVMGIQPPNGDMIARTVLSKWERESIRDILVED